MGEENKVALNWVDRKAQREALLASQSGELWNQVRAAIQDACESFRKNYGEGVSCKPENGKRLRVVHTIQADRTTNMNDRMVDVLVEFESNQPAISVTYQTGGHKFLIEADQQTLFLIDGNERKTIDEVCERILGKVLFPPNQPQRRAERYIPPDAPNSWM